MSYSGIRSCWPEISQVERGRPREVVWPYVDDSNLLHAISAMLRVDTAQAAKVAATIRLTSAGLDGALKFCAKQMPSHPVDADVQRLCDRLFDRYREKWWLP
jgi:hypothetical protein